MTGNVVSPRRPVARSRDRPRPRSDFGQSQHKKARRHTALIACIASFVLLASACALPVTVKRADPETVQRQLTGNVLTTGELSFASENLLRRYLLTERFEDAPEHALAELHATAVRDDDPNALFVLSELSFYHARETDKRPYYLAAAVYAYAYLFPAGAGTPPNPIDPRLRAAVTCTVGDSRKDSCRRTAKRLRCGPGCTLYPSVHSQSRSTTPNCGGPATGASPISSPPLTSRSAASITVTAARASAPLWPPVPSPLTPSGEE